jgi:hypothetical protein
METTTTCLGKLFAWFIVQTKLHKSQRHNG